MATRLPRRRRGSPRGRPRLRKSARSRHLPTSPAHLTTLAASSAPIGISMTPPAAARRAERRLLRRPDRARSENKCGVVKPADRAVNADSAQSVMQLLEAGQANIDRLANVAAGVDGNLDVSI